MNCPTCGCSLATKRPPSQYENKADYLRFKRKSYALQGICTRCMRNPVLKGFKRCSECKKADADNKKKRRVIGSKKCGCGKPAMQLLFNEYICGECYKKESNFYGLRMFKRRKKETK